MAPGTRPYPGRTWGPGPGPEPGPRGPEPGRPLGPGRARAGPAGPAGPGRPGQDPGPGRREITGNWGPGRASEKRAKQATYARKVALLGPSNGPPGPSKVLDQGVAGRGPAEDKKYNPICPGDRESYFFDLFWAPLGNPRAFA